MTTKHLIKAYIEAKDSGRRLSCRFNPTEYTVGASASWASNVGSGNEGAPVPQFVGSSARTLQLELFFDQRDSASGDVAGDVDLLFAWTSPTRDSIAKRTPRPPLVVFHWGTSTAASFQAYVQSVSARYSLFRGDGSPIRANVNVTLQEAPQELAPQNPTSGGPGWHRTHTVCAGDTLQSIAYAELGDATAWRVLAEANGIDDPLRMPVGTRLLVPPASSGMLGATAHA
jgi:hypothetical protein